MSRIRHSMSCLACLALVGVTLPLRAADDTVQPGNLFRTQVAPILQRRCLSCHNDVDRQGGLSLQSASALADSGFIEPGRPDDSHLLSVLVAATGEKPAMPKNGASLTSGQVSVLSEWIKSGAVWPDGLRLEEPVVDDFDWWSLQSLVQPAVPDFGSGTADARWIRTPIDAFILERLNEQGLAPSPEADRRTLIRRLTFDLLGLPPTPEDVEAFINDDDPKAYEHLVDRLLQSPHYGERWARHWLDVVRYADTCGYDKDKLRPNAWPYRDYVVRSFNNDKPYGQFVQEQIAGDVLFPGNPDGILGLGFIAAGPWDFIGHVEVPESKLDGQEARNLDRDEMVSSTLNTFCSVTVQCARCHNHKFDPFTQQHYYALQAIFAAVDRAERPYDLDPAVEQKREELTQRLAGLQQQKSVIQAELTAAGGQELVDLDARIKELRPLATPKAKAPEYGYHSQISAQQDQIKWVQVDLGRNVEIAGIVLRPCHDEFAGIGAGFGFPVRFRVEASNDPEFSQPDKAASDDSDTQIAPTSGFVVADYTRQDFANPGLAPVTIEIVDNKRAAATVRYVRVTATRLAERSNDYILALAELQVFDRQNQNMAAGATVTSLDSIEAPVRWRRTNLTDGLFAEAADEQAVAKLAAASQKHAAIMEKINTPERQKRAADIDIGITAATRELDALPAGRMVYAAATRFAQQGNFKPTGGTPRTIHVLHRGNITQPGAESQPGTIPVLQGRDWRFDLVEDHTEGDRRAALAKWITDRDHPLTWRSIVNRVWQYHFGRGIVESPNDFGRMGQLPTHPQLLDWLAADFRDNGQSFRSLHRLIVTSSVYRQQSTATAEQLDTDSDNRWLGRMNRRRLEAEEIRDAILSVSGRLNPEMGGPGYYLFVLEKTAHSPHYEYHLFDPNDPASHRRSLYRFIVRSQPDPYMTALDCADSSQSTPRRDETLTSLQALSLLNNRFTLAMAEQFAARVIRERDSLPGQINRAFELTAGRAPTDEERGQLVRYAQQHGLPNLCRVLLNLSEFLFID